MVGDESGATEGEEGAEEARVVQQLSVEQTEDVGGRVGGRALLLFDDGVVEGGEGAMGGVVAQGGGGVVPEGEEVGGMSGETGEQQDGEVV